MYLSVLFSFFLISRGGGHTQRRHIQRSPLMPHIQRARAPTSAAMRHRSTQHTTRSGPGPRTSGRRRAMMMMICGADAPLQSNAAALHCDSDQSDSAPRPVSPQWVDGAACARARVCRARGARAAAALLRGVPASAGRRPAVRLPAPCGACCGSTTL